MFTLMACSGGAGFILIYYIPIYRQFTRGFGALQSGVRSLPLILTFIAAILVNGAAMSKSSHYKPWYIFGGCGTLVGGVLICEFTKFTDPLFLTPFIPCEIC